VLLAVALDVGTQRWRDKPTFVLTSRELPRTRDTVAFHSGDLARFVNGRLRPTFHTIKAYKSGMVELRYEVRGLSRPAQEEEYIWPR